MIEDIFFGLQFSALIFFNLLCFIAIIGVIIVISTIRGIGNKVGETMDSVKDTADNINEVGTGISGFLSSFLKPKKQGIASIISSFLNR
jgi:hypothetical protein